MPVRIVNRVKKESDRVNTSLNSNSKVFLFKKEKRLSLKKKAQFYSELSTLLSSGVELIDSLELINENIKTNGKKTVFDDLIRLLISGSSLSGAMENLKQFSSYEYYSVEIGEETGSLITVIENLHQYFKKHIEQKRKMISTFSYPIMVLFTAAGALSFMLGFVVPMFEDIFTRYGKDLPVITQFVINFSDNITSNWYWIILIIIVLIFIIILLSKQKHVSNFVSKLLLRIPFFGTMIKLSFMLRFFTAFELLIKAHTPLIESLSLLNKMVIFYPINETIPILKKDVLSGKSLFDSMKKHNIYDKKMLSLIKISEHVNMLDSAFNKLKNQYTNELDHKSETMGNVLEPLLIIIVGLIVGTILVSMYLPIFEFSSSIGV